MRLPKILLLKISLLIFSLLLVFFIIFSSKISAYNPAIDNTTYSEQFKEGLKSPSWEKSSFDFTTFNNITESVTINIIGTDDSDLNNQLGTNALETMANLTAYLYKIQPASSVEYFASLRKKLQITQPVYAQGIGFEGLKPIQELWKIFRDSAYAIFAVIIVFVGFAVMFRLKINPQTVINIQSALPKIIVTLILITFSYAIAGLLIDLIYVVISLFANLIEMPVIYNRNLFGLTQDMLGGFRATAETLGLAIREFINDITINFAGWVGGRLAKLIFSVALLFSVFKLFFTLVIAYISIIAGTIFSPIMLMVEAIPGQKGLINWLKMMLTNIIPFVIVGIFFLLGGKIISLSQGKSIWVGPFLGISSTDANIATIIGFAVILATPSLITSVQKIIGGPSGIAGMTAGVIAPITAAWGAIKAAGVGAYQGGKAIYEKLPSTQYKRLYREAKWKKEIEDKLDSQRPKT